MATRKQSDRSARKTSPDKPDDGRQQAWSGADPAQVHEPGTRPLREQRVPQPDGVRSGTDQIESGASDRSATEGNATTREGARTRGTGLTGPRPPVELTRSVPGEPNTPDEAGEASPLHPVDPTTGREDVLNTSTSSGLHPDDEGSDDLLKRQLREGHQMPSRMD